MKIIGIDFTEENFIENNIKSKQEQDYYVNLIKEKIRNGEIKNNYENIIKFLATIEKFNRKRGQLHLTEEEINTIDFMLKNGYSIKAIAHKINRSETTIKTYKDSLEENIEHRRKYKGEPWNIALNELIDSGVSKNEIADNIGVTPDMVLRYALGTYRPSSKPARKLKEIYGISVNTNPEIKTMKLF